MDEHIINISFGSNHYATAKPREKHSYGQEIVFSNIELPEVFQAYFSNSPTGEAKPVTGQNGTILIPDEYFLSGDPVYCYLLVHDTATDGRMKYVVKIPVEERPEPTELELTEVQRDIAAEAIATLQEATERVTNMAEQVNDNLTLTNQNVELTNDNVTQSSLNAESAKQSAKEASDYALASQEKASLARTYMESAEQSELNAEQSERDAENIVSGFRTEADGVKSDINSKVSEAKGYSDKAKQYSDLAEETVSKWINEENDSIITINVTGMNPKINATANTIYLCGELLSLDFTPCADGICDIIFSSGTTPTLLTLPDSVRMPNGFEVFENRTYEINILNGIYGVATSWA